MNRNFPDLTLETASPVAREILVDNQRKFGAIPRPLARLAASPVTLQATVAGLDAFERTSLAPLEREVLAMTMGRRNGCHFCVALHRRILEMIDAPQAVREALENDTPLESPRLEAVRAFTLALLEHQGDVPDAAWQQLLAAGFDRAAALEMVLGVATYTLTTFANRLTQAPLA